MRGNNDVDCNPPLNQRISRQQLKSSSQSQISQATIKGVSALIIQKQKQNQVLNKNETLQNDKGERQYVQNGQPSIQKQLSQNEAQNQAKATKYIYQLDIKDLQTILAYCQTNLTSAVFLPPSEFHDPDASIHPSFIGGTGNNFQDDDLITSLAGNDSEIKSLLRGFSLQRVFNQCQRVYLIENAKIVASQVYQTKLRGEVLQAVDKVQTIIREYQSKYEKKTLRLCFNEQAEMYTIFVKVFGQDVFKDIVIRKIFAEIFEACLKFRDTRRMESIENMCTYFYLKVEMFCRGRGIFDGNKKEFPLHKAVFEKNLPLISRLVKCQVEGVFFQEKNELDSCGNTPLVLAVKLGHIDCIKILCDLYSCPKLKSLSNFPCALDIASSLKNKELIKILLEANQKIKQHYLDLHKDAIFSSLESLPDFKMDMHFKVESNFIPFLDHLTPSDTYRIYKKGSQLRLDMTLVGFRNLKSIRGNLSVLFKGRGQPNEGELFVVNHETGGVSNIFTGVVNDKLDRDLEDIMAEAQYQKMYKADKFEMEPVLSGGDGPIVSRVIEGYRAQKYKMRTQFTMTKYKISAQEVQMIKENRIFEEYLHSANPGDLFDSQGDMESEKREFSSTTPNPFTFKVASSSQERGIEQFGVSQPFSQNAKKTKKTINATLWLCKDHPLSLDSFLPLLQVLSFSSKQIAKFKDYLSKYPLPPGTFPLKAKIPIFFTMQAAFSLRNLSFDQTNLPDSLFTIDKQKQTIQQSIGSGVAPADLEEIYKMIKTGEDNEEGLEDEEENDNDSVERANEMYNSMLKKMNQSEDLLQMSVGEASFNSEASESMIVDLSERQVNDEQFKLATHKFSQIQTMDQINGRHENEDSGQQAKFQAFIQAQIARRLNDKVIIAKQQDAENIYDSNKGFEEKPKVNIILTKNMLGRLHKPPLSTAVPTLAQGGIITPAAHSHKNSVETSISTTKKNFQPRTFNYPPGGFEETSLSVNQSGVIHRSTADNSIVTTNKQQPNSKESDWFKQIIDYKNALLGKKKDNPSHENRLQTIESEEIVATEGCQHEAAYQRGSGNNSRAGSRIGGIPGSILNNSSMLSQGDDNSSRRSIIPNSQQIFDSTSVLSLGSVRDKAFGLNDSQGERKSLTKEGIKTLANHNTLITKFHDYVVTNSKMIGSTKAANSSQNLTTNNSQYSLVKLSSQLKKNPSQSKLQVPYSGGSNVSLERSKQHLDNKDMFSNNTTSLLPPKISHKRQTSFGAGKNEPTYNNSAPGSTIQSQMKKVGIPKPTINSHFEDAKSFMQAAAVAYQVQSRQDHHSYTNLSHSQSIPQKSQALSTINNSANTSNNGSEKGILHISRQDIGGSGAILGQSNSFSCLKQNQGKKTNDADIFLSYQV